MSASENQQQGQSSLLLNSSILDQNAPTQNSSATKPSDDNPTDDDDAASCTSSLEEEEHKPHWDVGDGDIAIYNDTPSDRSVVRFLQRVRPEIIRILESVLLRKKRIKYNTVLQIRFNNNYNISPTAFKTEYITLESAAAVEDTYDVLADLILLKIDKVSIIYQVLRVEVNIKQLRPRCGSYIELPAKIPSFKAVINFRNYDNYCFKYAMLTAIKYLLKDSRVVSVRDIDIDSERIIYGGISVNFTGLTFPVEVRDVRIFEENNPNLSVNVFGLEKRRTQHVVVGPLYRTRREQPRHINLLFLENPQKNMTHYAYITRLAALIRGHSNSKCMEYICNTCLKHFIDTRKYQEHKDKNSCEELRSLS